MLIFQFGHEKAMNEAEKIPITIGIIGHLDAIITPEHKLKIDQISSTTQNTEEHRSYLKELFFIIGKESLIENGNWYLILKEKEPGIEGI